MGFVLITYRLMPEAVETDLDAIKGQVEAIVTKFGGKIEKFDKEEVAFGLISLIIILSLDEKISNLDPLEDQFRNLDGVESAESIDVRRMVG